MIVRFTGVSIYRVSTEGLYLVSGLGVHPGPGVLPGDGLPQLLVAQQHDGEGEAGQPPHYRPQGPQLQTLRLPSC